MRLMTLVAASEALGEAMEQPCIRVDVPDETKNSRRLSERARATTHDLGTDVDRNH